MDDDVNLMAHIGILHDDIDALTDALQFYGDERNWNALVKRAEDSQSFPRIMHDHGALARRVLGELQFGEPF